MRLRGKLYTDEGHVESITFRVITDDLPPDAEFTITDVQLQHGEQDSGYWFPPQELGTPSGKTTHRNGVIYGDTPLVLLANIDAASPIRFQVQRLTQPPPPQWGDPLPARIGSYRLPDASGTHSVDGVTRTATAGWGQVPIVTARSDLHLDTRVGTRAFLRVDVVDRAEDDWVPS